MFIEVYYKLNTALSIVDIAVSKTGEFLYSQSLYSNKLCG